MENKFDYETMDIDTKKMFMLAMQMCFAAQDKGVGLDMVQDFLKGAWETVELNGPELREILYQAMTSDLLKMGIDLNV